MVTLRPMTMEDLPLFRKWLASDHVRPWYEHPQAWIDEIEDKDGSFSWISHFIALENKSPIGFCQFYDCANSGETWDPFDPLDRTYSIDYLIGEKAALGKGYGKQMINCLVEIIREQTDARRIVVCPEKDNHNSCGLLRACGFRLEGSGVYCMELD